MGTHWLMLMNCAFLGKPLSLVYVIAHLKGVNNGEKRRQLFNALKKSKVIFINPSIKTYISWA